MGWGELLLGPHCSLAVDEVVTPLEVEGDLNDEASSVEASLSPGADSCYFGFVGDAGQELGVQLVDAAVRSDDQGEQGGIFFLCHLLVVVDLGLAPFVQGVVVSSFFF